MPNRYFNADGFVPRNQDAETSRTNLVHWLSQNHGAIAEEAPVHPSPWHWSVRVQPHQALHGRRVGGPIIREVEQTLFAPRHIPIEGTQHATGGFVTRRFVTEMLESDLPEHRGRGSGAPFHRPPPEPDQYEYWDVVRTLPRTDQEAIQWGYTWENAQAWEVIVRECARYNANLHQRVVDGYSAGRAHAATVTATRQESIDLIYLTAFQLAVSGGAASSRGSMGFAPFFGDYAGNRGVHIRDGGLYR